jgi:perosamine synthetase
LIIPSSVFPRVPLAVPYWNRATDRNILRCLVSREVVRGRDYFQLESFIGKALAVDHARLFGSASLALEAALRACDVSAGDEVVLPTFCCTAVVPPVLALGATPVLADIGSELNLTRAAVEAVLTRKTRAVIVPHLFGNPAEIDRIVELVRGRGIRVIDDAAQALGATLDDQCVGSFGDAGVISFGAEKVCFGLGGGVALTRDDAIANRLSQCELSAPTFLPTFQNLAATLFWRRWRGWTLPLISNSPSPDEPVVVYRYEMMSNLSAAVALSLMQTLRENITARRARVEAYRQLFSSCSGLELVPHRIGSACLNQVIRVLPQRRYGELAAKLIVKLRESGYEVQGSYVPIHLLPGLAQCVWDRLPEADKVWAELVELPCEPTVALEDVERIVEIVKNCIRE